MKDMKPTEPSACEHGESRRLTCENHFNHTATVAALQARVEELEAALVKLRDCDWTISLPDRMDAVRDIAREALK